MHIERPASVRRPISLTPLVDVIFLLLLFFMLSSTFTNFGQVEFGAPASGGGAGPAPDALVVVEPGTLRLNGRSVDPENLKAEAAQLLQRNAKTVLLLARGEATTQDLVSALSTLKSVPELTVIVAK
jgi:biopolymer transport protein ExbD